MKELEKLCYKGQLFENIENFKNHGYNLKLGFWNLHPYWISGYNTWVDN